MIQRQVVPMRPGETLGQWRGLPAAERERRVSWAWAGAAVSALPRSWADRLIGRWSQRYAVEPSEANREHLKHCRSIEAAQRAGVRADACDADLVELAQQCARECARRIAEAVAPLRAAHAVVQSTAALWAAARWLERLGLADAWERVSCVRHRKVRMVLLRVQCDRWWRRVLRSLHAKAVEATARVIGLVHKRAGCYVSDDGLKSRRGQLVRTARVLEGVAGVNDKGDAMALAELAARGTANREIRRHELMTRIAGFELIARECDHVAYFVTITCPSRMHRMRTAGWGVEENPSFDGTRPDEAQRYLTLQWARARTAAQRAGLAWYGFRIAEPNHDGTPHWHALMFFPRVTTKGKPANDVMVRTLRRYFLDNDSPEEKGAQRYRIKVERIDWNRGSAAGYVAKYVAKNIDGYKVERDLFGNDAITSSQRVDAWASRWRVRQFQQVGGAPVTIWRELRRLHPDQAECDPGVALALEAVNITAQADQHETEAVQRRTAAHGWATYQHLQGGPYVPRKLLRMRLLREQTGEVGRYGELMPPRAVGVEGTAFRSGVVQLMGWGGERSVRTAPRPVALQVESERADWIMVPNTTRAIEEARARWASAPAQREAMRPWSPVNNCTGPLIGPGVERHRKLGRWAKFERRGPASTKEPPPCAPPKPSPPI